MSTVEIRSLLGHEFYPCPHQFNMQQWPRCQPVGFNVAAARGGSVPVVFPNTSAKLEIRAVWMRSLLRYEFHPCPRQFNMR
jgi:hypothetical protein